MIKYLIPLTLLVAAPIGALNVPTTNTPTVEPVEEYTVTSSFGMRRGRPHRGIDLAAPTGTPVYATADGIVNRAARWGTYGNYVEINHGETFETRYAHMNEILVEPFDRVERGDIIGRVGSTGRSSGPHLHYEIRLAGQAINPMRYYSFS